jgi:hypothetical protein
MAKRNNVEMLSPYMMDITKPKLVEITIRDDGKVVWVNVDSLCRLRCCDIKVIKVDDRRTKFCKRGD